MPGLQVNSMLLWEAVRETQMSLSSHPFEDSILQNLVWDQRNLYSCCSLGYHVGKIVCLLLLWEKLKLLISITEVLLLRELAFLQYQLNSAKRPSPFSEHSPERLSESGGLTGGPESSPRLFCLTVAFLSFSGCLSCPAYKNIATVTVLCSVCPVWIAVLPIRYPRSRPLQR